MKERKYKTTKSTSSDYSDLFDICIMIHFGDNDFSETMRGAGEMLSHLLVAKQKELLNYIVNQNDAYYRNGIDDYVSGFKQALKPEQLLKTMRLLYVSAALKHEADCMSYSSQMNHQQQDISDFTKTSIDYSEYLMGDSKIYNLWVTDDSGCSICKVGTKQEIEKWFLEISCHDGSENDNCKSINEVWNNSETLVIEVKDGCENVYVI